MSSPSDLSIDESVETENDDFMSENVVQQEKSKFNSMKVAALIDTGSSINIILPLCCYLLVPEIQKAKRVS